MPALRSRWSGTDSTFQPALTTARRDIYKIGGYKEALTFDDHFTVYERTFGGDAIELMPNKAFSQLPIIKEGESDGETTQFEKDCLKLIDEHDFFNACKKLAIFSRVFTYGGLIVTAREPDNGNGDKSMAQPIGKLNGVDSIVRFDVVMQDQISAEGVPTVEDFSSAYYGMPKYFNYDENVTSNEENENARAFKLDSSRVFTFSETAPPNKLEGMPFNQRGFNYISNCEKVLAAAPEGFIKNSRGMTVFNIKDPTLAEHLKTEKGKEQFQGNHQEYNAGINTAFTAYGMDVSQHQINIADPNSTFMINFNSYAMTVNTSASILLGKQEGERASTEDMNKFIEDCKAMQNHTYTPMIKRILKWLWEMNAITKPTNRVIIDWPDLAEPTVGEKIEKLKILQDIAALGSKGGNQQLFVDGNDMLTKAGFDEIELKSFESFTEDDE